MIASLLMGGMRHLGECVAAALLLAAATASAQEASTAPKEGVPAEPTPAQPAAAPDVVRLKDGSMFRGTISERVAGDYVEIVLVTGKTRRFTMDQVEFAGAAASLPGPKPEPSKTEAPAGKKEVRPLVTIRGEEARVSLVAVEPNVTFHRRAATAIAGNVAATGYDEICVAPCEATLPAGTYTLALSKDKDKPLETDAVRIPAGSTRLEGKFKSRAGLRTGLLLGGIAAAGVGTYLMFTSSEEKEECDSLGCNSTYELNSTKLYGGGALMIGGGVLAWYAFGIRDKAQVTVQPVSSGALSRRASSSVRALVPAGLSASAQF